MTREQMSNVLIDAARTAGWAAAIEPIVDAMPMRRLEALAASLTSPDVNEMSLDEMDAMLDTAGGGATRAELSAKVTAATDENVTRSIFDNLPLGALRTMYNRHVERQAHVEMAIRYAVSVAKKPLESARTAATAAVAAGATDFTSIYNRIIAA